MRTHLRSWPLLLSSMGLTCLACAQSDSDRPTNPHRLRLNALLGFNITAEFSGIGKLGSQPDPGPPTGGGIDRFYDDGFVRVDRSGNNQGLTWFWGYNTPNQTPGDDTLLLQSKGGIGPVSRRTDGDPQTGLEVSYGYEFHHHNRAYFGLEFTLGFIPLEVRDRQTLTESVSTITDTYPLGGIVPPVPPYRGTFDQAGPLIGDTPVSRATVFLPGGATITGRREINADFFAFRFGPWFQWDLCERASVSLSGGLAWALVDSRFDFNEQITFASGSSVSLAGSNSRDDWLVGGYIGGQVSVKLWQNLDAFASAHYQALGDFVQSAAGHEARLNLDRSVFLGLGLRYSF